MNTVPRIVRAVGPVVAAATVVGSTAGTATAVVADIPPEPKPFMLTGIAAGDLTWPDRRVVVARIDLPPGGYVDWHRHPGRTTGVVTTGTLRVVDRTCDAERVDAGEAFVPPRSAHTARNTSDEATSVVLTFVVRGEAPTVFVSPEVDRRLDRRCGLAE